MESSDHSAFLCAFTTTLAVPGLLVLINLIGSFPALQGILAFTLPGIWVWGFLVPLFVIYKNRGRASAAYGIVCAGLVITASDAAYLLYRIRIASF
jgi:hypothetical protein